MLRPRHRHTNPIRRGVELAPGRDSPFPLVARAARTGGGCSREWLWRYAEVSRSANSRYLEALAVVDDDRSARRLLDRVTKPAKLNGRAKRALQPLSAAEQQLFLAALRGEHRLRGFRNKDLAQRLYAHGTSDRAERRRRCARVTRLIQLLRAHGLVAKIPRTRRYRVTVQGELLMSAALKVKEIHLPKAINEAA